MSSIKLLFLKVFLLPLSFTSSVLFKVLSGCIMDVAIFKLHVLLVLDANR